MKKQKNRSKLFLSIVIVQIFIIFNGIMVFGEGIGFEIIPTFSNNQFDKSLGYYYLETHPGEKQEIEIQVNNTRNKDITVRPYVKNAITNTYGNLDYTEDIKKIDESLKNPITEIVKPRDETVTIKPGETETVIFDLTSPEKSYSGVKMGQLAIIEFQDDSKVKGVGQEHEYGLGIITSETGEMFNDGNNIILDSAQGFVSNGTKVIRGKLQNPDPKTVEKLRVDAFVTKKGNKNKIKERKIENFSFAPNSNVQFEIPWGLTNFETGEYTFHFVADNDFDSFNLTKDFTIRGEDAKKLNSAAAFSVNTPNKIKIILILLNLFLIIISGFVISRNKKWINELKSRKKQRNKKGRKKKK